MKTFYLFVLTFIPCLLAAGDSAPVMGAKEKKLRGYRQLFYKLVAIHPRLNSTLEKKLLQHYLLGSGETFVVSEDDFKRLQQTVPFYVTNEECKPAEAYHPGYCVRYVNLHDDDYFGWGLGNVTVIYNSIDQAIVSLVDYYDFDKKPKGKRRTRNEFITGMFRLLAPQSARSFVVTYNADAYIVKP